MSFKKDTSKVRSFSGGPIKETGFYALTINKAYDDKSKEALSEYIVLDCSTEAGQYATVRLTHIKKDGNPNDMGIEQINDMMVLLDLDELKAVPGRLMLRDWNIKQDVEQKKMVYKELIGKTIGSVWQMRESIKFGTVSEKQVRAEFLCFCDAETMASTSEFVMEAEPVSIQKYINTLDAVKYLPSTLDAHTIKQAQNQPNAPVQDPVKMDSKADEFDDFDDDIPF